MSRFSIREIIEAIGIAGVIGSLIFVGLEIQQNSAIARSAARQAITDNGIELALEVTSNPELADLLARIYAPGFEIESISPAEDVILSNYFLGFLQMWESEYEAILLGVLPSRDLIDFGAEPIDNAYMRERWQGLKPSVSSDIGKYLESLDWLSTPR